MNDIVTILAGWSYTFENWVGARLEEIFDLGDSNGTI